MPDWLATLSEFCPMIETHVTQMSLASVLCNYLLESLSPVTACEHMPGNGLPEYTVRVDRQDVVFSFTCVAPPMFSCKVEQLARAQSIDVVLVRCFTESFDALPATVETTLAGGGLPPFTLTNLTLYRHQDGALWFVPTGFGAAVKLTDEGLQLYLVPPYETLTDRAHGIYKSTAEIATRLYPEVVR